MPDCQVLYWRDIPAQVRVYDGRKPLAQQLPPRFQVTIDRVAMEQGLAGTDEYLAHWQWSDKQHRDGEPAALLAQLVQELIEAYDSQQQP